MIRTAIAIALLPFVATAQSLPPDLVAAQILPGWQTDRGTRMIALRLTLADGWKTYWRSPGDAGIPPEFDWAGSTNLKAVAFHWPVPDVFETNGMETLGYHHELVLPIEVTPVDPSRPIHIRTEVDMGVCRDICVPTSATLSADLSGRGQSDPAIRAALADQPKSGARQVTCHIDPIKDGLRVTARMALPRQGASEVVVMEPSGGEVWASPAEVTRNGNNLTAISELVAASGEPFALDRSALRLTVVGYGRAVEVTGCPAG